MLKASENRETKMKPARHGNMILLAVAIACALLTALFLFSRDREFAVEVLRALFGLAGGSTAGG